MSIPIDNTKIVSTQIFEQLPGYIKENYATFAAFLEAYFEWMELSAKPVYESHKILSNADIDTTLTTYVKYFESKFLYNIPTNLYTHGSTAVNKAELLKYIRQFYLTKGTEKSFKLLFRILFNEDVSLYYPRVDMLYASDGKWSNNSIIRTTCVNTEIVDGEVTPVIFSWIGKKIIGETSEASAIVENALQINMGASSIGEFYLSSIIGTFVVNENIYEEHDTTNKEAIYPIITNLNVVDGGTGYSVGDEIFFTGGNPDVYAEGVVSEVRGSIKSITLESGGVGYTTAPTVVITGTGGLARATATLTGDAVTQITLDDPGRNYSSIGNVTISFVGGVDLSNPANSAATASATISGEIIKASIVSTGLNYSTIPNISLDLSDGTGANITPVVGALYQYPGEWLNTDGFISSDKKIQDSYYYQVFSYVVKSTQSLNDYELIVKNLLHPAGLLLFGKIVIETEGYIGPTYRSLELSKFNYQPCNTGFGVFPHITQDALIPTQLMSPNQSYWFDPFGYGNTTIEPWLAYTIEDVTGANQTQRTNLAPDVCIVTRYVPGPE